MNRPDCALLVGLLLASALAVVPTVATDEPPSETPCTPPKPVVTPPAAPPSSWVGKGPKHGEAQLEIRVDKKGHVHDPIVIQSGGPDVDKATIEAVREWRFTPGMCGKDSKETKVRVVMQVNLR
jgi:TonB family protein